MSEDKLSPEEIVVAGKIHDNIVKFLTVRYLTIVVVISVVAPIIGLLAGALFESKYFSDSRDTILEETKLEISEEVDLARNESRAAKEEIKKISESARSYLNEIRSTRESLNFILTGTSKGELAFMENRSREIEGELRAFDDKLKKWEKEIQTRIPQGFKKLQEDADELGRLQNSVDQLRALFAKNAEASALAGAFYKIYELIGKVELQLFVPSGVVDGDLDSIRSLSNKATAIVTLSNSAKTNPENQFQWLNIGANISVGELAENIPTLPGGSRPKKNYVTITLSLDNQESWWKISGTDTSTLKTINIEDFSKFDTISIKLSMPHADGPAQIALSRCQFSTGNSERILPRKLEVNTTINRVAIPLLQVNGGDLKATAIKEPYYGESIDFQPSTAKPEKPGTIVFTFSGLSLFHEAARTYVNTLGKKN